MRAFRMVPGFKGRTGRLAYVGGICGALAVAVAFNAAMRAIPIDMARTEQAMPAALAGFLMASGLVLFLLRINARRLRDAGRNPWWAVFPFGAALAVAPIEAVAGEAGRAAASSLLNVIFVLTLCLLAPRPGSAEGAPVASEEGDPVSA
jgi:uncharacterized membrane protein YhaH (DUF805 family)